MSILPRWIETGFPRLLDPLVGALTRAGVHPNAVTTLGFLVTVSAGIAFFLGHVQIGGALVLLGGTFDIIDGRLARSSGLASAFGSFYDSTLDRISEVVVFLGIFSLYNGHQDFVDPWMVYVVGVAMAGSLMVSYTRARAEGLGIDCKVGMMQRPERILLIGFAALIFGTRWNAAVLTWVLIAMAATTSFTTFQRIVWVFRHTPPRMPLPSHSPSEQRETP